MISVIVSLYNTEKYLDQCLNSIIQQTYKDFECIIIDDGSTDDSLSIAKRFESIDCRFKVYTKENSGVSSTRNFGINIANGDYILFVDADDWIEKSALEILVGKANQYDVDIVICDYYCNSTNNEERRHAILGGSKVYRGDEYVNEILATMIGPHGDQLKHPERSDRLTSVWAKLYKKSIIKSNSISFTDLRLVPSECQLFNIEFLTKSSCGYYISEPLYHYRRNTESSLTKKYRNNLFDAWKYYIDLLFTLLGSNLSNRNIQEAFDNSIAFSIIQLGGNAIRISDRKKAKSEIATFLRNENYCKALSKMNLSYLPLHWKMFFYLANTQCVYGFYWITVIMRKLMDYRKR